MKSVALLLALLACPTAEAVDRIVFQASAILLPGVVDARQVVATLSLLPDGRSALQLGASEVRSTLPEAVWRKVQLRCARLIVREPDFACQSGRIAIPESPLGPLQAEVAAEYLSTHEQLAMELRNLPIAGGALTLTGRMQRSRWQAQASSTALSIESVTRLLSRWWQPPEGLSTAGKFTLDAQASGQNSELGDARLQAQLTDLVLQNEAGTIATENLRAKLAATITGPLRAPHFDLQLTGLGGQALGGPVLLDFSTTPLELQVSGQLSDRRLLLAKFSVEQSGFLRARGSATLLAPEWQIELADVDVAALQFPAAYKSLLQLALASTSFGALDTAGNVAGRLAIRNNQLVAVDLSLDALNFGDTRKGLRLDGLTGDLHWSAACQPAPAPSLLRWRQLHAYGLEGGASELKFHSQGSRLLLDQPARIPLFDGALAVQRFDAGDLGGSDVTIGFDATIEPISMQRVSAAFGWPEMSGQLAGRLPGLDFRSGTLRVNGDITAQVFDGQITARNLQLRDALRRFPRLSGDFIARGLDLDLMTRTFPIGSISGRLDADISGLELFGWSPVAFDANLYTTPGDRSRHRISQKAVNSLAKIGGGGGGVAAALQSGLLRFFDDFGYDRIGLRCKLSNDVCLMGGAKRAGAGYYIVKGGGLPRIDIIGNSDRVAWAQLLEQINAAVQAQSIVVN